MTPVIEVEALSARYGRHWILRDVSLTVQRGEVVGLVGGSGSGKTTLLRQMIGLLRPVMGSVRIFGQPLFSGNVVQDLQLRRRVGMLFQHGALFSAFNVYENVAFPLRELRILDETLIQELVLLKLSLVELLPGHALLMPAELSGGMTKRAALARALSLEPELLLLDEPTAGLDPDRSESFVRLIRTLRDELNLTVVLVTHDLETLGALATRVAVLADQRIVAFGSLREVMNVNHPFVDNFFRTERARRALGLS